MMKLSEVFMEEIILKTHVRMHNILEQGQKLFM